MPILKTYPGLTKSETLGVGPNNLFSQAFGGDSHSSRLRNLGLGYPWRSAARLVKGIKTTPRKTVVDERNLRLTKRRS